MPDAPQGGGVEEVAPLGCFDCGLVYGGIEWIETSLPNDVWEKIAPREGGGGVLCITCIARRLARLGLRDVPVRFVGTEPLRCADERATLASQADAGDREGVVKYGGAVADYHTGGGSGDEVSNRLHALLSRLAALRARAEQAEAERNALAGRKGEGT